MKKIMSKLLLVIMIFSLTFGNAPITVKAAENKETTQLEQRNKQKETENNKTEQQLKDKLTKEGIAADYDVLNPQYYTNINNTYLNRNYNLFSLPSKSAQKLNHSTVNMVVMLIDFPKSESDPNKGKVTVNSTYTDSQIKTLDNAFYNDKNSLHNYISTVSDGQCAVNPVLTYKDNNQVYVYTADHPVEYYEKYSESNPTGYTNMWGRTTLITDAFDNLKKYIPSDLDLDVDDNGYIDSIDFFVSAEAGWNEFLWSYNWQVKEAGHTANGAKLSNYNQITYPTYDNNNPEETITHEYLHRIGFPDMYTYSYNTVTYDDPLNSWTIMTYGTTGYPTVWERNRYGEWISSNGIKDLSDDGEYLLSNSTKDSKTNTIAYKVTVPDSNQFFMIEYRDKNDSVLEKYINHTGIISYRVDPNRNGNSGGDPEVYLMRHPNWSCQDSYLDGSDSNHQSMDLVLANGKLIGTIEYAGTVNGQAKFKYKKNADYDNTKTTIYYKGYDNPYIHYKIGDGTWTQAPGVKMEKSSEIDGYDYKITVDLATANKMTACFNNGYSSWDNNYGNNYTFGLGYYTVSNGVVTKIDKPVDKFEITSVTSNYPNGITGLGTVNINVAIKNASGTVYYTYIDVDKDGNSNTIQENTTSDSIDFTPSSYGKHTIKVIAKDGTNTAEKTMELNVKDIEDNKTVIYYKGYDNPYIHYKIGNGSWTIEPGVEMENSTDIDGYNYSISIDLGNENKLTACFNNGNGTWDNNYGNNYIFDGVGTYTFSNGNINKIN